MALEDIHRRVLEYLKKQGKTNTFNLAKELNIDRYKILDIIEELEEKQAVEFKSGSAKFLRFPEEEKIVTEETEEKPQKETTAITIQEILKNIQDENKRLGDKISELEKEIKRVSSVESLLQDLVGDIKELKANIEKTPAKGKEEPTMPEKEEIKPKKTKTWIKKIQQLKKPEFIKKYKN